MKKVRNNSSPKSIAASFTNDFIDFSVLARRLLRCLVNYQTEVAELGFFRSVGTVLAVFVAPVRRNHNVKSITDHSHLENAIDLGRR